MIDTTFSKVLFKDKNVPYYKITNRFEWWGYVNKIKARFPYKLADYYVSNKVLYITKNASVDAENKTVVLEAVKDFSVNGNNLIINNP